MIDLILNDIKLSTDGTGLWSNRVAEVRVTQLKVPYVNEEEDFGELRVYFATETWDVMKDGLIYTDDKWLDELQFLLVKQGFSLAASRDVEYSEQGMQGDNFVSLDVGKAFLDEWLEKAPEVDHL